MNRYSFALVFIRDRNGTVDIQLRSGNYKANSENEARGHVIEEGMRANPGYALSLAHVWELHEVEEEGET